MTGDLTLDLLGAGMTAAGALWLIVGTAVALLGGKR